MNLIFSPYQKGEDTLYLELVTDLNVMKYITEQALSQVEGTAEFAEILAYNQVHQDGSGYFKVSKDDCYLGFAKVSWAKNNELEVGYMLLPEFWGRGYGKAILKQLLTLVASHPDLAMAKVFAVIDPNNVASKQLLTTHNFVSTWVGVEEGLPTEYLSLKTDA